MPVQIRYMTVEEVILSHEIILRKYGGGSPGVRDEAGLAAAVYRPQAVHFGVEVHPTIWDKAAALTQSLVQGHYFYDGNKRTAYAALETFLRLNGFIFAVTNSDAEELMVSIAMGDTYVGEEGLRRLAKFIESGTMSREEYEKDGC
jgi:death on curing protein